MSTGEKYFHFPADQKIHEAVKAAAAAQRMSMAGWLHKVVREALEDEEQVIEMLMALDAKLDRIIESLEGS